MLHRGYLGRKFLRDDREIRSVVSELVDKVCEAVARESVVDGVAEGQKSVSKTTTGVDSANNELNAETVNKTVAST